MYLKLIPPVLFICFFTGPLLAQLNPGEKEGVIYDQRVRYFKPATFRYNGEVMRYSQVEKLLVANKDSKPYIIKARRNMTWAASCMLVSAGFMVATFVSESRYKARIHDKKNRPLVFLTASFVTSHVGEILAAESFRHRRNAINKFNKESLLAAPKEQPDSIKDSNKILFNPGTFRSGYYYQGKLISVKKVDELLSKSAAASPFYLAMQKNKKVVKISGLATAAFLLAPIVSQPQSFNTPVSERSDKNFVIASLVGLGISFPVLLIAEENVLQHRYNAYRLYNGETPYPFNRRHERLIKQGVTVGVGVTENGMGLVVNF